MHKKLRKPTVKYRRVGFSENQKIRISADSTNSIESKSFFPGSKFLGLFAFLFLATLFLGFNYFIYSSENQKNSSQSILGIEDQLVVDQNDLISEITLKDELNKTDYYRITKHKISKISEGLDEINQVKLDLNPESDAYKAIKLELELSKKTKQQNLEELKKIKKRFEEQNEASLVDLLSVADKLFILGV